MNITSRENVIKALKMEHLIEIPTELHDTIIPDYSYGKANKAKRIAWEQIGSYTDEWGCVWEKKEPCVTGEVVSPILANSWEGLDSLVPPWEVFDNANMSRVNASCASTDKFVIPFWEAQHNPFERMQQIRGTEQLFADLAYGDAEVYQLREIVHSYYLRQAQIWAKTDIDAIHLADDWGTQISLLISPDMWREYYKPLYKDYCDIAHSSGKFVVMHSDGNIQSIIGDLIEIGVDAINSQIFAMGIEKIAEEFAGKICFWGEFDRQYLLTKGTVQECRDGVRRIANAFFKKARTGIVGQTFIGSDVPNENYEAVYDEWKKV